MDEQDFCKSNNILIFQGSNVPDEDIRYAGDKFKESLELASDGMANLLDNEVNFLYQQRNYVNIESWEHCFCNNINIYSVELGWANQ